eukprot:GILK01001141.1.p1 GENE.GILK01001141.1~~GILK01001141.1.p1  ORF type:complete len:388 (+),score=69.75 GILK01001141.1:42-1205(+)
MKHVRRVCLLTLLSLSAFAAASILEMSEALHATAKSFSELKHTKGYEWPTQLQEWPISDTDSRFRFENAIEIGVGTNAKAFLVFDRKLNRDVVVKTLSHQITHESFIPLSEFRALSKAQQERLLRDCSVLQLIHGKSPEPMPGQELVMKCYEAVTEGRGDAPFFFVLEYVGPARASGEVSDFKVQTLEEYLSTCTEHQFVAAIPVLLQQLYRAIDFLTTGPEETQFSLLDLHFGNVVVNGQHEEHLGLKLIDFGGALACSDSSMIQSIDSGDIAECASVDIYNSGESLKLSIQRREEQLANHKDASRAFSFVTSVLKHIGLDQLMDPASTALMTVRQAIYSRFFSSWKRLKSSILKYVSTKRRKLWLRLKSVLSASGIKGLIARNRH